MTINWDEFKRKVEAAGVKDDTELFFLDVQCRYIDDLKIVVDYHGVGASIGC